MVVADVDVVAVVTMVMVVTMMTVVVVAPMMSVVTTVMATVVTAVMTNVVRPRRSGRDERRGFGDEFQILDRDGLSRRGYSSDENRHREQWGH